MSELSDEEILSIHVAYASRFPNLRDLWHPAVGTEPAFARVLQAAMERGEPATRQQIVAAFPGESVDYQEDHVIDAAPPAA